MCIRDRSFGSLMTTPHKKMTKKVSRFSTWWPFLQKLTKATKRFFNHRNKWLPFLCKKSTKRTSWHHYIGPNAEININQSSCEKKSCDHLTNPVHDPGSIIPNIMTTPFTAPSDFFYCKDDDGYGQVYHTAVSEVFKSEAERHGRLKKPHYSETEFDGICVDTGAQISV